MFDLICGKKFNLHQNIVIIFLGHTVLLFGIIFNISFCKMFHHFVKMSVSPLWNLFLIVGSKLDILCGKKFNLPIFGI